MIGPIRIVAVMPAVENNDPPAMQPRHAGNHDFPRLQQQKSWMLACAGMTATCWRESRSFRRLA